ncbi:MAG TPA: Uma2 family endonuclease [Urbifossiella sp.]|nr:Uma2 family endonuclease [Urbifossiella sp.]
MRPSKKIDRWLFRGELRESEARKNNPGHAKATASLSYVLGSWISDQPHPRGRVYSGECYFRIRKDPETNVGIDVAISTPEQAAATKKKASFVDGPPLLAVEVLSPYDKMKDIDEAIEEYLDCGVRVVWIVNPYSETVAVYRAGQEPRHYSLSEQLPGGPELPGFQCCVAEIFE